MAKPAIIGLDMEVPAFRVCRRPAVSDGDEAESLDFTDSMPCS